MIRPKQDNTFANHKGRLAQSSTTEECQAI